MEWSNLCRLAGSPLVSCGDQGFDGVQFSRGAERDFQITCAPMPNRRDIAGVGQTGDG